MQPKTRKRSALFFFILHLLIIVLYLLVCLVPFLDPGIFWFIAALGLVFPFLLILVLICLVVFLIRKSKWALLPLAALLISWQQLSVLFRVRFGNEFNADRPETSLRVLSWNVSRWTESQSSMGIKNRGNSYRGIMMDIVQLQNADVLCFQEFFECYDEKYFQSNIPVLKKMGYQYLFFSPSYKILDGVFQSGLIILSRYPIIDSAYFQTVSGGHSEGFNYADVRFQNKTVRVFNTHLESIGLNRTHTGETTDGTRGILNKLKKSYDLRSRQVNLLRKQIDLSPNPVILCGDLDDVPNSYTYFKARGNLQDAFLKKGSGIGGTMKIFSPTLRIDYILADPKFQVEQFRKLDYDYSDHYPLVTDLKW